MRYSKTKALQIAKRAFGPVYREPVHGWWTYKTEVRRAMISAGPDRNDVCRCRNREIICHALILSGWPRKIARAYAMQAGMYYQTLSYIMSAADEWRDENVA